MITLIGTSTTVIGFGLCGIKDIHEVGLKVSEDELINLIKNAESNTIMIEEQLYEIVKSVVENNYIYENKIFMKIPDRFKESFDADDIDSIVKDTIGINIQ